MRVAIKNGELELFKRIMKNGYAIGDGSATKRVIRELRQAGAPIHRGYDKDTQKVIVALEFPLVAVKKQRNLAKTVFELK